MSDSSLAFTRIGGEAVVREIVGRFYDLIEADPAYAELLALHHGDLGPVRQSLAQFLVAWLGGPRDWFDARPGRCIMGFHRTLPVTMQTAAQWAHAMDRAISADPGIEPAIARQMSEALHRMCRAMAVQARTAAEAALTRTDAV